MWLLFSKSLCISFEGGSLRLQSFLMPYLSCCSTNRCSFFSVRYHLKIHISATLPSTYCEIIVHQVSAATNTMIHPHLSWRLFMFLNAYHIANITTIVCYGVHIPTICSISECNHSVESACIGISFSYILKSR